MLMLANSLWGFILLMAIWKDCVTQIHRLAFYGTDFVSLENSYLCFWLVFVPFNVLLYFRFSTFFFRSFFKLDELLLINRYANIFVFRDFNVHHRGWLNYSGGSYRPGELCYDFIVMSTARTPDSDSRSPALLDLFFSSDLSICSAVASLYWKILIM